MKAADREQDGWKYTIAIRILKKKKVFGPGIAQLLQGIEESGSLHKAASQMNMAYSKAWKIIRESESELGYPLTAKEVGGKNGGGSVLTQEGRELLNQYKLFIREVQESVDKIFEKYFI